jgi:CubicO group peptidase (beta-lactamase class C family)
MRILKRSFLTALALGALTAAPQARARLPDATPEEVGFSPLLSSRLDGVVQGAISRKRIVPGGVLVVVRHGRIAYRRAFGMRALLPSAVPNTESTVYDLASLTKVTVVAPAVMALVEDGRLALDSKLVELLPATAGSGKDAVTVEQLLRHRAGLPSDDPMSDYSSGVDQAWLNLFSISPELPAGRKFLYSDVGFLYLGRIVERLSGMSLDTFAAQRFFAPLEMKETGFRPADSGCDRCAPTEKLDGEWRIGLPHDPRAYALGGIAGNAGVFSTADDLAQYAQMILGCGALGKVRVLRRETVRAMAGGAGLPQGQIRGLGWDIDTQYSTPRGQLFPVGSFGHTGYTGTSLWMDPSSDTAVVLLTNRVHPVDQNAAALGTLRGQVADTVARSIVAGPFPDPVAIASFCR